MALVVEEGLGDDPTANTYNDVAGWRIWATERGMADIPADDTEGNATIAGWLLGAMDWLNNPPTDYVGRRVRSDQPLSFPRYGIAIDGVYLAYDAVPAQIIQAQNLLALELKNGTVFYPTVARTDPQLASKKIGPIAKSWFQRTSMDDVTPNMTAVIAVLRGFLTNGFNLTSVRV